MLTFFYDIYLEFGFYLFLVLLAIIAVSKRKMLRSDLSIPQWICLVLLLTWILKFFVGSYGDFGRR